MRAFQNLDGGGFVILEVHGPVLVGGQVDDALGVGEQVVSRRDLLGHGVVALQGEGDGDRPVKAGGPEAQLPTQGIADGEDRPLQGDLGPGLQAVVGVAVADAMWNLYKANVEPV